MIKYLMGCVFLGVILTLISWTALDSTGPVDSVLNDGQIFSFEIEQSDVYQLTGAWLQNNYGNAFQNTPFSSIHIYGIVGGPLNEDSNFLETERLRQIPIYVEDNGDGNLNNSDKILFYAEGASTWVTDQNGNADFIKNSYSNTAKFFIKIGTEPSLSIEKENTDAPNSLTDQYQYQYIYHEDVSNLLGAEVSNQGSGQTWYGPDISNENSPLDLQRYLSKNMPELTDASISMRLAGRSASSENLSLQVGSISGEKGINAVNTGNVEELYARIVDISLGINSLNSSKPIEFRHTSNNNDAKLWLDHIQVEGQTTSDGSLLGLSFNNIVALQEGNNGIAINGLGNNRVWDITDPLLPFEKEVFQSNLDTYEIRINENQISSYIIIDPSRNHPEPVALAAIENQNICAIDELSLLIIYPVQLESAAIDLAIHRENYSNIKVEIISLDKILNEYSAGRMDPTAIRNYIRDLYNNGTGIQHVLLFGDASYDYRYLRTELPNENLIPTYETKESLDPLLAFPSDDYFALLDDNEGGDLRGDLDLSVGRVTVRTPSEAEIVVDKIKRYDLSNAATGPWKTKITFMADDEDNNLHLNDADRIAREVQSNYPVFNQSKIYLDAFVQESTPGGNRYPGATESLNGSINQGSLILNYLGHGGPRGWCQERVLKVDDITSWTNTDRLPLIITATCSFTGFDDPALTTAGESVLLQPNGGGIALFTTVRSVYASKNFRLTQAVFRNIFEKENGNYLAIGEIMRRSKNDIPNDNTNARKFFLIGDPSMHLSIPSYNISTASINGRNTLTSDQVIDTVGALDLVRIEGQVNDPQGNLSTNFNGIIDISIFDKPSEVSTLGNDNSSFITEYESQENVIYKGKATVINGKFDIEFRVPVDIDYSFGIAKISYYALSDDETEAIGANQQLVIVGSSEGTLIDQEGPTINLFLNDRNFESGDVVGPNNLAIVDISDDNGINLSTAAIGHEMIGVLDNDAPLVLNQFFEPSLTDPNAGTILFDVSGLDSGEHTLKVKVFDVLNNAGMSSISFLVDENISYSVDNVILWPNPISDQVNISMNSDIRGAYIDMEVLVFNSIGQLVGKETQPSTFDGTTFNAAFDINHEGSQILFLQLSLIDRVNSIQTEFALKKVISLK